MLPNILKLNCYLLLCLLLACGSQESSVDDAALALNIPELLPRPAKLQQTLEWDKTQSGYMQMSSKLRLEDPLAIKPRITLAQIFANEARVTGEHGHYYPAALQMVNEALDINKGLDPHLEFEALSTKASLLLSQHDFSEALTVAKRAITLNPHNAQIYGALVDAQVELGDYEAAVASADKMTRIRPDLRSYSRVSYLREIHGDIPGAIEAMEMAVTAGYPGYESTAWARLTLAEIHHRYGDPEAAELEYRKILAEREDYPFAIAGLAQLAMDRGDYQEAEKLLHEAKSIIPEVGFYEQLAEIYAATDRKAELAAIQEEILVMLQDDVDSGHNMNLEYAAFYRDLVQDYDKALEYAKREYDKRPANIDVNLMMGSLLVARGEKTAAAPYLEAATVTASKNPELTNLLAMQ
ncbi:lipopolysaccharide assembly protein LapB [Lewinella sp. W8]|uniref:tetratricopeptide repeat protein n=1 Tax=Lewinella sp. W8 TaxID=2528208 RepID=UPI00106839D8|nr:tetratricopeptide repeat protein [Lewinella sp. W8]MTB50301.1 tetratricopeptide repeat protein [Lewinella sp. W8]